MPFPFFFFIYIYISQVINFNRSKFTIQSRIIGEQATMIDRGIFMDCIHTLATILYPRNQILIQLPSVISLSISQLILRRTVFSIS